MTPRRREFRLRRFPPVQFVLYLLLRTFLMVVGMFPFSMAPDVARWIGRLVRLVDRRHGKVAAKNLERARTICPPDEIPEYIERVYEHLGLNFVEMLMMPGLLDRGRLEDYTRLEGLSIVREVLRKDRGLIVVMGHLGNWEIIGLAVCKAGLPLHSINRPIENPWIDRFLTKFRTQTGQRLIPKRHAVAEMVRVLRKREILVVQIDQDARKQGVFTDFFGRPASTHRSAATLSLKYGVPIMVANIYREGGQHHLVLSDPLDPETFRDEPDPVRALTQAYTTVFEGYVRAHPEQWFWIHDRWKSGEKAAAVPQQTATLMRGT